jgi:xanthosine utilization system XapX-like protein
LNVRVKFAYNAQRLGGFQAPVGFIAATEGQGSDGVWGLPSSSGVGTSHVFVHDIEKDLAPPILGDIQYEILPFDRADEAGTCLDIECDLWVQGIVHGCNLTAYGISVDGDPVATVNIPGTALCPVCSVSGVQTPGAVKVKSGNLSTLKLSVLDVCHNQGIGDTTCFFQQPVDGAAMWIVPKDSDGTVIMCEAVALPGQLVTFGNCLTSVGEVIGVSACYPQTVVPSGTVTISGPATVAYGDSLTLTLDGITGIAPPYTYQWYLNATPIVGATDVNYGPVLADFGDAGAYNLMVNGLYTSNTVTVAVTAAPPVLAPIPDMGVTIGDTLTISTQLLSGGEPITYQWYKDDVIIIGATALSYSKAGATTGDDGVYKIVATGPGGTTYQQATVSLAMAPAWVWYRFDEQPVTSTTLTDSSGNNRLSTLVSSFSRVDGAIVIPQSTGTTLRGARLNALMPLSFRNPPIAMMAWVKPAMRTDRNTAATYSYQPYPPNVLSNDYPGQGGHGFGVNVWAADGIYSAGSALIVAGFGNIAVPGGFAADTWYHVAISMGSTYKTQVWVNGVRIYTSNTVPGFTAIQSYLYTGRHNDDTNYSSRNNFAGAIDEARVYDRELSSAELNAIYLAGRSRPTPYDLTGEGHYLYGDGFQVIGRNFN